DRAALEEEIRLVREAREARLAAEQKRHEDRVRGLNWQTLLEEQPFARWDQHPPFPHPNFTEAARERVRSLVRELQSLGNKPKKTEVRALLKSAVKWFNARDAEFDNVIETEERQDICALLTDIASVAGHPALANEIDSWRKW